MIQSWQNTFMTYLESEERVHVSIYQTLSIEERELLVSSPRKSVETQAHLSASNIDRVRLLQVLLSVSLFLSHFFSLYLFLSLSFFPLFLSLHLLHSSLCHSYVSVTLRNVNDLRRSSFNREYFIRAKYLLTCISES